MLQYPSEQPIQSVLPEASTSSKQDDETNDTTTNNDKVRSKESPPPNKSTTVEYTLLDDLNNDTTRIRLIAQDFHDNGFLILRQVLDTTQLQQIWKLYAHQVFQQIFKIMYDNGHIEQPTDRIIHSDNDHDTTTMITYTMKQGMKHGFTEIVMRSPGRYEISLLHLLEQQQSFKRVESSSSSSSSSSRRLPDLPKNPETFIEPIQSLIPLLLGLNENDVNNNNNNNNRTYKLIHCSIVVATPGSTDQAWHADGGHINIERHRKCHCFNIFIPLQDTTHALGPTEIRPKSHFITRGEDLTKNMLLAKCKKTLAKPIWPELDLGDILIFDYRILHRGRANTVNNNTVNNNNRNGNNITSSSSSSSNNNNNNNNINYNNGNRSYLVLTYAESWFFDVLNFPKNKNIYDTSDCITDNHENDHKTNDK